MIQTEEVFMNILQLEREINDADFNTRIEASRTIGNLIASKELKRVQLQEVNNHVHTTYSFSPYEPAAAAYAAWKAGLGIVGSIDHDSIGAADEMLVASQNLGIASTVGFELRVSFLDTALGNRKINNPDSQGIVYMCVHGVPQQKIAEVSAFLEPIHVQRNLRNKAQVEHLQSLVGTYGFDLDFERDVVPLSHAAQGGSITERHILFAMANQCIGMFGKGEKLVRFLQKDLQLPLSQTVQSFLLDDKNPHYAYDLLGVFKSNFLSRFFIQPTRDECPDVRDVVSFGNSIGAIPAYAYLGDVKESVTGDKKQEKFEDDYLVELMDLLADIGYPAITYMPPRNTLSQMQRLQNLAKERGMMEISGVDINSSRQSMNCPELLQSCCSHLVASAWALVAHEKLATCDPILGLFHPSNPLAALSLDQRLERYAEMGKKMDSRHPLDIIKYFD